jgi:subtilisin family serine protease
MKRYAFWIALLALGGCNDSTSTAPEVTRRAALINTDGNVAGQYIVVTNWDVDDAALAAEYGIKPTHTYEHLLNGFSGAIPDDVVQRLAGDARVISINVQRVMQKFDVQPNATWGIDRVDQRLLPLDRAYTYDVDAANVNAYVLDMGIRATHEEFEGRAVRAFDAFTWDPTDATQQALLGSGECDSHATHVAGTIGGKTFGIAKKVRIFGVRVLNCAGYGNDSDVIAGLDWVAANAQLPAVANMSLGDVVPGKKLGTSTVIDSAVIRLINSGVTVAIAAGNGYGSGGAPGYNSCDYPLANIPQALVVGATTAYPDTTNFQTDYQTSWTSFGPCVDVYAPGQYIWSSTSIGDDTNDWNSGTSMATPHVAGVAALVLAQAPGATPKEVHDIIVNGATLNVIAKNANNTTAFLNAAPLRMLYSRVKPPPTVKKNGKTVPCTPRRQLDGVC